MSTRISRTTKRTRKNALRVMKIRPGTSRVAQLLHDRDITDRSPGRMADILICADRVLDSINKDTRIVVSGAGLLESEFPLESLPADWRSEEALSLLIRHAHAVVEPVAKVLAGVERSYVVGLDIMVPWREHRPGVGQFAVVLGGGRSKPHISWKSFPTSVESGYLAGYGTSRGLKAPRKVRTRAGQTCLLVCHDVVAYHGRSKRATRLPERLKARIAILESVNEAQPRLIVNLIHEIKNAGSAKVFIGSHRNLAASVPGVKLVAGFGFGGDAWNQLDRDAMNQLASIAARLTYPNDTASSVLAIRG